MWRHVPVVASGRARTRVNVTKPVGLLSSAAASQPPDSVIVRNIYTSPWSLVSPAQPSPAQPSISTLSVAIHCANTGSSAALLPSHRDQCGYSAECVDRAEQWSGVASVTLRCSVLGPSPQVPVPAASSSPAPVHTSNQFCGEMVWACCRAPASTQQLSTRRHSDTATSQAHVMCFI